MKKRSLTEILLSRFLFSLLKTVVVLEMTDKPHCRHKTEKCNQYMAQLFYRIYLKVLQYSIVIRDIRDWTIDDACSLFPSSLSTNSIFILLSMTLYPFTNPCIP